MSPELLQRFCAVNDERLFLSAPQRMNGFIYASNGHIMVEIPDDARPLDQQDSKEAPKMQDLFERSWRDPGVWLSPATVSLPAPYSCLWCDGTGNDDLGGICSACNGSGHAPHPVKIERHERTARIDRRYLELMSALPDCELGLVYDPLASHPFRFSGGRGLVMPMA